MKHHIVRTFTFPDFKQALEFVNRVGEVAETRARPPSGHLLAHEAEPGREITLWTHKD